MTTFIASVWYKVSSLWDRIPHLGQYCLVLLCGVALAAVILSCSTLYLLHLYPDAFADPYPEFQTCEIPGWAPYQFLIVGLLVIFIGFPSFFASPIVGVIIYCIGLFHLQTAILGFIDCGW